MTSTQVDYLRNRETERHNRVSEAQEQQKLQHSQMQAEAARDQAIASGKQAEASLSQAETAKTNATSQQKQAEAAKSQADTAKAKIGAEYIKAVGSGSRGVASLLPAIGSVFLMSKPGNSPANPIVKTAPTNASGSGYGARMQAGASIQPAIDLLNEADKRDRQLIDDYMKSHPDASWKEVGKYLDNQRISAFTEGDGDMEHIDIAQMRPGTPGAAKRYYNKTYGGKKNEK